MTRMNEFIEKYGKTILIVLFLILFLISAISTLVETAPYDSSKAYQRKYGDARAGYESDYYAKHKVQERNKSKARENLDPYGHGYSVDKDGNVHYGP